MKIKVFATLLIATLFTSGCAHYSHHPVQTKSYSKSYHYIPKPVTSHVTVYTSQRYKVPSQHFVLTPGHTHNHKYPQPKKKVVKHIHVYPEKSAPRKNRKVREVHKVHQHAKPHQHNKPIKKTVKRVVEVVKYDARTNDKVKKVKKITTVKDSHHLKQHSIKNMHHHPQDGYHRY